MLNPLIAYLAFYWLTLSVILQKNELTETKIELRKSAYAQSKTSTLNAYNSLLISYNHDLSYLRDNAEFIVRQMDLAQRGSAFSLTGTNASPVELRNQLTVIHKKIGDTEKERSEVINIINRLLADAHEMP